MIQARRLTMLAMAIAGCSLGAQESTGMVLGIVRDTAGKPLAGATVVIAGQNVLGTRTILSDAKGEYRLPLLLPGNHSLKAYKEGYLGQAATFTLVAGQILRQEFVLKPKVELGMAVVEVVAEAAALDKSATSTSTSFTLDTMESLPLTYRNAWGAAQLAPGIVAYSAPVIRGGMLGGAQGTVNGIYVRGTGSSDTMLYQADVLVDDLVEDATVVQSTLNAKYGNTSSGLVTVTTKTGSNDFHGSIRSKLSKSSWQAVPSTTLNRFGTATSSSALSAYSVAPYSMSVADDLTKTYEIALSGPIIKDRITFVYGARITPDSSTIGTYYNVLGSTSAADWKTYIPGVTGVTNSSTAGYLWGNSTTSPTLAQTATSSSHTEFNQYELYFQLAENHQLKVGYSLQTSRTVGLNTATVDTSIQSGGSDTRHQFKSLNYRALILDGKGILDAKWGRRATRDQSYSCGPNDPIYVRTYTSTATSILNTGSTQATSYITNGFAGVNMPSRTASETAALDFQYYLNDHQINVGLELLKDSELAAYGTGPNNRVFYSPGRLSDGSYLVYNFVGSIPATDLASGGTAINPNTGLAVTQAQLSTWLNSTSYIPQMVVTSTSPGDPTTRERTMSFYLNDLYQINPRWGVMGGLRHDGWKVSDRSGTRISSAAWSPRMEVKWDPLANSRHLFSFSVADMRATFTNYLLSTYLRKGGNITQRYFWNQGSPATYSVSQSQVLDPANYGYYYYYSNSDQTKDIDSTIKPDRTRQYELKYARAFDSGGSFRISAIYRKSYDMLTAWGYDKAVIMVDPNGSPIKTSAGAYSRLQRDPYGKRDIKSVEVEWSNPLYRSAALNLTWAGNYTFNRGMATENYSEGNSSPVYYEVLAAQNIPLSLVNPYGERQNNSRHNLKTWLIADIGSPKAIHHSFSLLVTYSTGQAISTGQYFYYPANSFSNLAATAAAGYTVSYPTTFTAYGQGRGNRRDIDTFNTNLKWSMVVPLRGALTFFIEATVTNLFNFRIPVYNVGNNSTTWASPSTTPTWNAAGGNDTSVSFTPSSTTLNTYGSNWYWTSTPRTFSFDCGFRF